MPRLLCDTQAQLANAGETIGFAHGDNLAFRSLRELA